MIKRLLDVLIHILIVLVSANLLIYSSFLLGESIEYTNNAKMYIISTLIVGLSLSTLLVYTQNWQ